MTGYFHTTLGKQGDKVEGNTDETSITQAQRNMETCELVIPGDSRKIEIVPKLTVL